MSWQRCFLPLRRLLPFPSLTQLKAARSQQKPRKARTLRSRLFRQLPQVSVRLPLITRLNLFKQTKLLLKSSLLRSQTRRATFVRWLVRSISMSYLRMEFDQKMTLPVMQLRFSLRRNSGLDFRQKSEWQMPRVVALVHRFLRQLPFVGNFHTRVPRPTCIGSQKKLYLGR